VQEAVSDFARTQVLSSAVISVDVRSVPDGRVIAAHQPELACIPASTQKLVTTAAAMDVLGPDYRFETKLVADGPIENGVLLGNLYIVGGGDPTLGSARMEGTKEWRAVVADWVEAVRARGITRITGAVVGDGSYFGTDGAAAGWPWADLGNYYGAGAYGLNLNENAYVLSFAQRPKQGATPPIVGTDPEVPGLTFANELTSGPPGSGDRAYIYGAPFNYRQFVRGSIPAGTGRFRIRGSIPDPPLFAARQLNDRLEAAGTEVIQPPTTTLDLGRPPGEEATVLHRTPSPPLAAIVDRTNLTSNNLYAEALFRLLEKQRTTRRHGALPVSRVPPQSYSSDNAVMDWLEEQNVPTEGVHLIDGSGLSPRNFFPPRFLTDLLIARAGDTRWKESIPLAGRSGSMRRVLTGTPAVGRLYAKSGTIRAVRAYAGYVDRPDGQRLAFSIAVNNHSLSGRTLNGLLHRLMGELVTAKL
jgi:D-alanyl-D-alanine carboxypeptidase/D-alanyl-D-alanine-endopeptidase (penicillin-binding protein 4)